MGVKDAACGLIEQDVHVIGKAIDIRREHSIL